MPKKKEEVWVELENRNKFLYQMDCLTRKTYLDFCCEYIEKYEIDGRILKSIPQVTRNNSYNRQEDHKKKKEIDSTNRGEEIFVLNLFKKGGDENCIFPNLIDYQIPLKNSQNDVGYGKIDFSYRKDSDIYLVEIKAEYSPESILKAIIEIQTYYQQLDREKFLHDFDCSECNIKKQVVVFAGTLASTQLKNDNIRKLLKTFEISVLVLQSHTNICIETSIVL